MSSYDCEHAFCDHMFPAMSVRYNIICKSRSGSDKACGGSAGGSSLGVTSSKQEHKEREQLMRTVTPAGGSL